METSVSKQLLEASLTYIVNVVSTNGEKEELVKTFAELDTNGDGKLSREELIAGYSKVMHAAQAEEETDRVISLVGKTEAGEIDYNDFVVATINRQKLLSKDNLDATFKSLDKDGSGAISIEELKVIFGGKCPEDLWQKILAAVDENKDGELQLQEFHDLVVKLL